MSSNQGDLWQREIKSEDLEEALDTIEETREAAIDNAKAKKTRATLLKEHNAEDGERIKIGNRVLTMKAKSGGGFEMGEWESVGVASVEILD